MWCPVEIIEKCLKSWNLPQKIFAIIPVPYYITSIFLIAILILIYEFLGERVPNFNWGYNKINSIVLSIVIGFMLFGIHFFLSKMQDTIEELGSLFENNKLSSDLRNQAQRFFLNSKLYYFILMLVVLSFIIIKIKLFSIAGWGIFYFGERPSFWALLLDLYETLLFIISIYLLATVVWIVVNIYWLINIITLEPFKNNLKINIFNADRMGGLRPIRDLIISFSILYFIIIIFLIMTWSYPASLSPSGPHGYNVLPYESKLLVMIWLIGVVFFISSWYEVRKLLFWKFEREINVISDLCRIKTQQLSDVITKDESSETEKHVNQISIALDVLHKERKRMLEFGARPMDIRTFSLFLGSSLSSLTAIFKTAKDVQAIDFIIDKLPHMNQLFDYLYVFGSFE